MTLALQTATLLIWTKHVSFLPTHFSFPFLRNVLPGKGRAQCFLQTSHSCPLLARKGRQSTFNDKKGAKYNEGQYFSIPLQNLFFKFRSLSWQMTYFALGLTFPCWSFLRWLSWNYFPCITCRRLLLCVWALRWSRRVRTSLHPSILLWWRGWHYLYRLFRFGRLRSWRLTVFFFIGGFIF